MQVNTLKRSSQSQNTIVSFLIFISDQEKNVSTADM